MDGPEENLRLGHGDVVCPENAVADFDGTVAMLHCLFVVARPAIDDAEVVAVHLESVVELRLLLLLRGNVAEVTRTVKARATPEAIS